MRKEKEEMNLKKKKVHLSHKNRMKGLGECFLSKYRKGADWGGGLCNTHKKQVGKATASSP